MTELLTAAQMRTIEQAAIDSGEVTGLELMERAGQGVVEAIFEEWPDLKKTSHRAVVLCGPGNNGGDGFVVARLLKEWGWEVEVFFYGDAEKLPADAKVNYERWAELRAVQPISNFSFDKLIPTDRALREDYILNTLIIDAIFGTGLSRPIKGAVKDCIEALSKEPLGARPRIVSVDLPSGVCSDSGKSFGSKVGAELTVTFHLAKLGHYLSEGSDLSNYLVTKGIGLKFRYPHPIHSCSLVPSEVAFDAVLPILTSIVDKAWESNFTRATNKFSHGHALICSGPATKTGAARLAARGALRIGAGLVTVASPSDALPENAAQLTAIMLREAITPADFETLLSDDRISSICIGPGFAREVESGGLDFSHTREMVKTALAASTNALSPETGPLSATGPRSVQRRPVVLDADALSAFQDDPSDLFQRLHKNCVLTPHGGEFKRLFPDIHANLIAPATTGPAYSKVDATRDAAKRAGCTVLFKGADTVIANEQGRACINSAQYDRAAPWLATAGSGDVLAGFITGLLARGFAPMQAAETAAWLHVECALKFGPGLIAEDISEQLPAVFADLGL